MKAIELTGFEGFDGLRPVEVEPPEPNDHEVSMEVKAAGINFAELEMTKGGYPAHKALPFIMGFEASGIVTEVGSKVAHLKPGDRITALVSSGGYAEYAIADASVAIPIPEGITFAEATTIPVQGLTAFTLLKNVARPLAGESILIQAAAGGVGLFLVQLARIVGVRRIIALASTREKVDLLRDLGADFVFNYSEKGWSDRVREATDGKGVDVVLEAASGEVGEESFKLMAPFGRMILYGARNISDIISSEKIRQLITQNQSLIGFNLPTLPRQQLAENVPELLRLISERTVKLFAGHSFPLAKVKQAFEALSSRRTIGKVVLTP